MELGKKGFKILVWNREKPMNRGTGSLAFQEWKALIEAAWQRRLKGRRL